MKKIFVRIHDRFTPQASTPNDDLMSPRPKKYRGKMSSWRSRFSSSSPSILRRKESKRAFSQSTPCFEQHHCSTNVASIDVPPPMLQQETGYSHDKRNMSVPEILRVLRTSLDENDDTTSFTSFRDTLTNSPNSVPCDLCPSLVESKRHTISYPLHQQEARSSPGDDETDAVVLQFRAWEPAVEQSATQSDQLTHVRLSSNNARHSSATTDDCEDARTLTLSQQASMSDQTLTQAHMQHCYSDRTQQESCNINCASESCANQGRAAKNSDQPIAATAIIDETKPKIDTAALIGPNVEKRSSSAAIIAIMHVDKVIAEMTLTRKLNQAEVENALLREQIARLESEARLALAVNAPIHKDRGGRGKGVAGQQDELLRTHALAQLGLIEYLEGEKDLGAALERFKRQLETELSDHNNDPC